MRGLRVVVCMAVLGVLAWPAVALSFPAHAVPAPALRSILPRLKRNMDFRAPYVPVCVPATLPAHDKPLTAQLSYDWKNRTFDIVFYVSGAPHSMANQPFWFTEQWNGNGGGGGLEMGPGITVDTDTRPALLRPHIWSYVNPGTGGSAGATISWWQREALFTFGHGLSDTALVSVARSLVCLR